MIRTVTGDISPQELPAGHLLTHEHVQCLSNDMRRCFGDGWVSAAALEDYAADLLTAARQQLGLALLVDGTPCDLGRDAALLRALSRRTGVAIVASAGFYWFPAMLTVSRDAQELAEILLRECSAGLEGTDVRPGALKCAVDGMGLTPDTQKRITAVGLAQAATGLPVYVHCDHAADHAHAVLDLLAAAGADLARVDLGHANRRPDPDYLEGLLRRGCYIGLDQCFPGKETAVAAAAAQLCRRGWGDRLLFSLDRSFYNDFGHGRYTGMELPPAAHVERFAFLFDTLLPACRAAGCTGAQLASFTVSNAIRWLNM